MSEFRELLGDLVCRVFRGHTYTGAADMIRARAAETDGPFVLSFVNAHAINLCYSEPGFLRALHASDVVLRDGIGMTLLYRLLRMEPGINYCGTDFIPYLLREGGARKIALLGTKDPYLGKAAECLRKDGHEVVLAMDGFRHPQEYVRALEETEPELVLLGMGMPKQELVSVIIRSRLRRRMLVINGGAFIDYLGEKVSRAPLWMRRRGLEWVYRLVLEPRRMYRRYLLGNISFIARALSLRGDVPLHSLPEPETEQYENCSYSVGRRPLD
ncbi:MAG: glycosyltransferase [Chitinophagaceae bacterium]|nr:MAG: glycosyltransferase [Chitinophagaceae bacterium]